MSSLRFTGTFRTDAKGPACWRGETFGSMRVARLAVVVVMVMVLGLAGFVSSAESALMQRTPTSDISIEWAIPAYPANSHYDLVDDSIGSNDGDNTYVSGNTTNNAPGDFDVFGMTALNVPVGSTINSVKVSYYAREEASRTCNHQAVLRIGDTNYNFGTQHNGSVTSYELWEDTWTTNPSGGAWTVATVNSIQGFGFYSQDSNPTLRVTQVYLTVDYTPPAGDTVTVTNGTSPIDFNSTPGATNQAINSFAMATNTNTGQVTTVQSILTNPSNISSIRLHVDTGTIGAYDSEAAIATVNSPTGTVNFVGLTQTVGTGGTNYLITVDVDAGATIGQTVTAVINDITVTAPDSKGTITDTSATLTVTDPSPPSVGTVTITSPATGTGTYVPADLTFEVVFTDAQSAVTCEYTTDGSTWIAGGISAAGNDYTCSASPSGLSSPPDVTLNMRGTSGGGTATATALTRTVDTTPPSTSAAPAGGTYSSDQGVTLTPTDAGIGAASTVWCFAATNDCVPNSTGIDFGTGTSVTVTGVGGSDVVRYLRFYSTDTYSNAESVQSETYNINQSNAAPTLSISEPNGTGDTVSVGANYDITYTLADSDNIVTAAFFYDTDMDLSGGTAISGACASAAEDSGSTCAWDTTGMIAGSYYVYGVTDDGVNAVVTALSPGQITITDPATTAGIVTATPGNAVININAPYFGDNNTNNDLLIEWGTDTSYSTGNSTRPHAASPYSYVITGLINGTPYFIRVTYQDPGDGVIGTAVQIFANVTPVAWSDNNLLHNSNRFPGTTKHEGVWGIPGEYAGGITCGTCHERGATNIKRVKSDISFPVGAMPGGGASNPVTFDSAEDGSSSFGDDTRGDTSTSTNVCEVCHSETVYHNYDAAANNTGGFGHENNSDCIKCHAHNAGFKATCYSCHGGGSSGTGGTNYWPDGSSVDTANDDPARHLVHMEELAQSVYGMDTATLLNNAGAHTMQVNLCGYCHATPGSDADHAGALPAETSFANIWDKGGDASSGYVTADGTCNNINCHNNQSTGTGTYGWKDAGTTTCTMCHTVGGSNVDPVSGLHNVTPTVSGEKHDDTLDAAGCAACHTDNANHRNGTTAANQTSFAASINYTAGAAPTCAADAAGCHDGAGEVTAQGAWARKWSTSAGASDGSQCDNCHGVFGSWTWNEGDAKTTDHTDPYNGNTGDKMDQHGVCTTCHGASYGDTNYDTSWGGNHGNGLIDMNGPDGGTPVGAGYDNNTGGCAKACHTETPFVMNSDSGWTAQFGDYGSGDCTACHSTGNSGAVVTDASPHVITTVGGTFNACTDCHPGGLVGTMHQATGVKGIPNNATVGIDYQDGVSASGAYSGYDGVVLGGDATTADNGKTEAEICWGCHVTLDTDSGTAGLQPVSEWGLNTDTNGGESNYNFGSVTNNDLNWTTTTWSSANFSYKNGPLYTRPISGNATNTGDLQTRGDASIHASAGTPGTQSNALAEVSCSYCHDVHDTFGGLNNGSGPFLRGSWMGNPYAEDGAPRNNDTWSGTNIYGAVPRGGTAYRGSGYQIDENNGDPTSSWSADGSSGLCAICHGSGGDDSWSVGTIDGNGDNEIDRIGTTGAGNGWIGANGHSNAVLGATGNRAANIFSSADRNNSNPTYGSNDGQSAGNPAMGYQQQTSTGNEAYGWRNNTSDNGDGFDVNPRTTGRRAFNSFTWGVTVANSGDLDIGYHKFSCSKCHNPHASRLPRLMITNCLDTKNNDWDENDAGTIGGTNKDGTSPSTDNNGVTLSQATSAQNCHRVKDPAFSQSNGAGWNTVTPW